MKLLFKTSLITTTLLLNKVGKAQNNSIILSQDYLYATRTNDTLQATIIKAKLNSISFDSLLIQLNTDDKRKAFWLNIYNASVNGTLKNDARTYRNRNAFYKAQNILIANKNFSLDNIEHGLLRRSKNKFSLGYINKLFISKTEQQLRVIKLDWHIHFALNCGAKNCPAIAYYTYEDIDKELALATKVYLQNECVVKDNTCSIPILFKWFKKDFGGTKGVNQILIQQGIIKKGSKTKILYKAYDWTLELNKYNF